MKVNPVADLFEVDDCEDLLQSLDPDTPWSIAHGVDFLEARLSWYIFFICLVAKAKIKKIFSNGGHDHVNFHYIFVACKYPPPLTTHMMCIRSQDCIINLFKTNWAFSSFIIMNIFYHFFNVIFWRCRTRISINKILASYKKMPFHLIHIRILFCINPTVDNVATRISTVLTYRNS